MSFIGRLMGLLFLAAFMLTVVMWWVTRPPAHNYSSDGLLADNRVNPAPYAFQLACPDQDSRKCATQWGEIWPR